MDARSLLSLSVKINLTSFDVNKNAMSYADFIIFKEHKFLRNMFSNEELLKTDVLKDLKPFHKKFVRFLRIAVFLQNSFKINKEFHTCFDDNLINFFRNNCPLCSDFGEIKELISDVKIKNKSNTKISKFMLQTYAFVYQRLIDFPQEKFDYKTVNFFDSVHRIINVKIHLHHSHVTGKIIGSANDFCNMKVRENQNQFTCVVHNFFGFNMFFLIKGIIFRSGKQWMLT